MCQTSLATGVPIHKMFYSKCPLAQAFCQSQHSVHTVHSTGLLSCLSLLLPLQYARGRYLSPTFYLPLHIHLASAGRAYHIPSPSSAWSVNGLDDL